MSRYRIKMVGVIPTCKTEGCEEPCRPETSRPGKFYTLCVEHQLERARGYSRAYIERDTGRFRANQKRYKDSPKSQAKEKFRYVENKDEHREKGQQWKEENRDRARELGRQHYARHKDEYLEYGKAYVKTERGKAVNCAKESRRRERLVQADVGDDLSLEYAEILRNDPCSYCDDVGKIAIDHINPLNGGGDGSWTNLTAACKKCNSSKRDKPLFGWLRLA
jgi:5-methylcytosine-specific restriction endonuclease McrA